MEIELEEKMEGDAICLPCKENKVECWDYSMGANDQVRLLVRGAHAVE